MLSGILPGLASSGDVQGREDAARSWFDKMGAALEAAKTLHIESRNVSLGSTAEERWIFSREGQRVCLMGRIGESQDLVYRTVSDGKRCSMDPFPNAEGRLVAAAPQGFASKTVTWFAQFGCTQFLGVPPGAAENSSPRISAFALRDPELLDGRRVQALRFRARWEGSEEGYEITLWLDAKSALPVKRCIRSTFRWSAEKGKEGQFIGSDEVYTLVRLNAPIPEGTFKVD